MLLENFILKEFCFLSEDPYELSWRVSWKSLLTTAIDSILDRRTTIALKKRNLTARSRTEPILRSYPVKIMDRKRRSPQLRYLWSLEEHIQKRTYF